jgi:hypothetical protein
MTKAAALSCLMLMAGRVLSNPAAAQEFRDDIPTHAHFAAGEQGWACNDGFKQIAQLCVLDTDGMASRGAWEVFNGQWRCRSGYTLEKGFCVPFTAPEHATLVGSGGVWECNWGFQRSGSRCKEIDPPAHGYLDASGHDWVCYPGFERMSDQCVASSGSSPSSYVEPTPRSSEPAPNTQPAPSTEPAPHTEPPPSAEPPPNSEPPPKP